VHKRLCGKNSKPFRFPSLDEAEAKEAKRILMRGTEGDRLDFSARLAKWLQDYVKTKTDDRLVRSSLFFVTSH
jgi:hypothetical protein